MTYREVDDSKLIQQHHKKLSAALIRGGKFREKRIIGYPSGHTTRPVNFLNNGEDSVWYCSWKNNEEIVNLFGRGKYGANHTLLIDLQFNYALNKAKKSLGGAFLEEIETGEISLAHRGIVTVINRIPKEVALDAMASHVVEAQSGRKSTEFLLVADLESRSLLRDIGEFSIELRDSVRGVEVEEHEDARFDSPSISKEKRSKRDGFDKLKDYFKEFTGERKSYKPKRIYSKSNHGKIVEALRNELLDEGEAFKSREIDLVVEQKKRALLFEVKTAADTQSVYTAIGQLSVHASPARKFTGKDVVQIIVLPEPPMRHVVDIIVTELRLRLVTFSFDEQGAVSFQGLNRL
ncbi:hypothetical protein [Cupriavidus sp. L7L]|uniref:hypothetical protein n=1 Tax=Cupriavidus sp. L7L TaxID=2546443 RepID=UPI001055AB5E|nr:hypothetical protein [Cupriavidus sp. L7L]TDF62228.1 hypothetical protein E1J61_30725 [Cupriavidus sp. L7L]